MCKKKRVPDRVMRVRSSLNSRPPALVGFLRVRVSQGFYKVHKILCLVSSTIVLKVCRAKTQWRSFS